MKTILLLGCLIIGGPAVYGGLPSVKVTVSDANDKIVYDSSTNARGAFRTANLPPGNYVVQFRSASSTLQSNQYLLVVSAGKKKVIADAVHGQQLGDGGVAMKVKIERHLNLEGQIASEQSVSIAGSPNVKIVNGRRYFFVQSATGSNLGPHWEEEGTASARNIVRMDRNFVQHIADHAGEGSLLDRYNGMGGYSEASGH